MLQVVESTLVAIFCYGLGLVVNWLLPPTNASPVTTFLDDNISLPWMIAYVLWKMLSFTCQYFSMTDTSFWALYGFFASGVLLVPAVLVFDRVRSTHRRLFSYELRTTKMGEWDEDMKAMEEWEDEMQRWEEEMRSTQDALVFFDDVFQHNQNRTKRHAWSNPDRLKTVCLDQLNQLAAVGVDVNLRADFFDDAVMMDWVDALHTCHTVTRNQVWFDATLSHAQHVMTDICLHHKR